MTREELFDLLRPIILNVTGVPECILADPNAPSPQGEYASLESFQGVTERGQPYLRYANSGTQDVNVQVETNVTVEAVVNFYGGVNPRGRAMALRNAHKIPSNSIALLQAGVGWANTGPINNLSALQSSRVEQRAATSIFLHFTNITADSLNAILDAPIGTIEYADGTVVNS